MKKNDMNWKDQDPWGLKEFLLMMLLEFVFVIGCIKFLVKPIYFQWFNNELYSGTLTGLTIAIVLVLGVYFMVLRPKKLSWSEVGIRSFSIKSWKFILLLTIMLLVGDVIVMVLTSFIGNSYENSKTEAIQQSVNFFTVLIAFVSAAIISPIYEEIFYRGFLYRWLRTRFGIIGAILLSSLIFTIVHIPTYNAMPVNFLSGIVFAWAYERTNSIWPSVIIHGLTNGIMVLLTAMG
ncbi:CPBP family intramembrane metalloprotease [Bacillus thuringiensis]|uniref:CPBP family intramembrane metalloprotease n=1 Tax=Bacillus thuringiensis TaxID=1428 RepID=A0ABD6S2U5_BACTU|nr:type II CAAX endopeptidase family protein [Bacillus thuringiensis]PER49469.1 CPBP family intramembrane metalloprotease [Bacillus thuringiensis]PEU76103.1 CPBP family intramembrane metalloprotease [Bacillus thuringiensis]PFI00064.1 CPBP family intramembrane metalloprotease [Bacillus thuringiensis]PFW16256.1 CPBP family intramembrane metalloprotease [Bacillus thuringiensis]PGY81587.1 CPBP family intramembrane metalloprotease [Bacillus thuringiensis]